MEPKNYCEYQILKLPERKNHSSHFKWEKSLKLEAIENARKFGFAQLSPFVRFTSTTGFRLMFMMLYEMHLRVLGENTSLKKDLEEFQKYFSVNSNYKLQHSDDKHKLRYNEKTKTQYNQNLIAEETLKSIGDDNKAKGQKLTRQRIMELQEEYDPFNQHYNSELSNLEN